MFSLPNIKIPDFKVPMNQELMDQCCLFTDELSTEEIARGFVGSDCRAIVSKYHCHPELVVEYNSFAKNLTEEKTSITEVFGNRNRTYIIKNTKQYLELIDFCLLYSYDCVMKLSKTESGWKREYFGDKDITEEDVKESQAIRKKHQQYQDSL